MSIDLTVLVEYWQGELSPEREAEVEEALFEHPDVARMLDAIARLDGGVRALVRAGRLHSGLTVDAVAAMEAAGLRVRTYRLGPGEVVPCTIAAEDLVVIRLHADFGEASEVEVTMDGTFDDQPPAHERREGVPVDRGASEVVLVYPGDQIRALPRSRFVYKVRAGERLFGEYGLDHHPATT
jgi:anti-sigma factor RsiW